jgi:NIPSNAP
MIYEFRTYTVLPGRMPALLKRFETKAIPIWERHGIKQVGFFTTVIGPDPRVANSPISSNTIRWPTGRPNGALSRRTPTGSRPGSRASRMGRSSRTWRTKS